MTRKHRTGVIVAVLFMAAAAAWLVPMLIAHGKYARPLVFTEEEVTAAPSKYLVLVSRAVERRRGSDSSIGYRTSRVCVYSADKPEGDWHKKLGPLPMRTETTTRYLPDDKDTSAVLEILRGEGSYAYGHFSVPEGVYWGAWRTDETARNKHAIALSDIGVLDNMIRLDTTETITMFEDVEPTGVLQGKIVPIAPRTQESTVKGNCFIHGSLRPDWHHRDSMGCLNLLNRAAGSGDAKSDWEIFEGFFRGYDIGRDGPILVAVVKAEDRLFREGFPERLGRAELDTYRSRKQNARGNTNR